MRRFAIKEDEVLEIIIERFDDNDNRIRAGNSPISSSTDIDIKVTIRLTSDYDIVKRFYCVNTVKIFNGSLWTWIRESFELREDFVVPMFIKIDTISKY